ncbi:MAG TPA: alginate lyase family protein [Pyrinomonadaceae bacterium]|nr:alginate lyase family protein [Pyrinomonadaceae bacterium]
MIAKLRKLRGRSASELADRGRRKAIEIIERVGVASSLRLPSDEAFVAQFRQSGLVKSDDLLKFFREPHKIDLFASFEDKDKTIATFKRHFSAEADRSIARADRICRGEFDLLGYRDLNFGGPIPDWHYEPLMGVRSPLVHRSRFVETDPSLSGDKKIVWELNRHQYFLDLGRAYWLTGDEKYAKIIVAHIEDWVEKNPPQFGINWVSTLEVAYRSISWLWAFHFIRDSPELSDKFFLRFLKVLCLNAGHIERNLSTYSSPNTHLTGEALGLFILGSFFAAHDRGSAWKARGHQIMADALAFQVREDGGYVEQSTQYQRYTVDLYLSLILLLKREGKAPDPAMEMAVRQMLGFMMHATQPNGETALIGDDDGGRLHFPNDGQFADFRSTLAVGAVVFRDPDLKFVAVAPKSELIWLCGPDSISAYETIQEKPPAALSKAFTASGIFSFRSGWEQDAHFVLIDCGEHGFLNCGHAHADALSFVLSAGGVPVFVDPGTYTYTADKKARDLYRSTGSHNCLTVNGRSSSQTCGPFSWGRIATARVDHFDEGPGGLSLAGTHDGFEEIGVKYAREFRVSPEFEVEITDRLSTDSSNLFCLNLILHPSVYAEIEASDRFSCHTKEGNLKLLTVVTKWSDPAANGISGWTVEPFSISPRYGALMESTKLTFPIRADQDFWVSCRFTAVI